MALPQFSFGQKNWEAFVKAFQWIRNAYGQYDTGAVKPPVDYSLDNALILYADKQDGTTAVPFMVPVDSNNITQLSNPRGVNASAIAVTQLGTPTAPTITPEGTVGSTSYSYKVVAKSGVGPTDGTSIASSAGSTSTGNATLSSTNYNQISFPAITGARSYDVYRTAGGATQGKIGAVGVLINAEGLVQNAVVGSGTPIPVSQSYSPNTPSVAGNLIFNDTGLTADGTTAPTTNTSGLSQLPLVGDIATIQLATPVNVVATPQGTVGSTTITYKIVARSQNGVTAASSAGTTTTANATLSASNNVLVTWNLVPGAISYDVYRTAAGGTPSTTGKIANVTALSLALSANGTYTDIGAAGDSSTAPTVNTTGGITVAGPVSGVGGANFIATENGANNAIATSAASGPTLVTGLIVYVQLAHTLQAGANTFAYNGGSALAIKSHFNTANNIGTAYAATGIIGLIYNGTLWLDLSE